MEVRRRVTGWPGSVTLESSRDEVVVPQRGGDILLSNPFTGLTGQVLQHSTRPVSSGLHHQE